MPDFEHPSLLGFQKWAEAIEVSVASLFGDSTKTPLIISKGSAQEALYPVAGDEGDGSKGEPYPSSQGHHWGIISIFCLGGAFFYVIVYNILSDAQSDKSKRLTSYMIYNKEKAAHSCWEYTSTLPRL